MMDTRFNLTAAFTHNFFLTTTTTTSVTKVSFSGLSVSELFLFGDFVVSSLILDGVQSYC